MLHSLCCTCPRLCSEVCYDWHDYCAARISFTGVTTNTPVCCVGTWLVAQHVAACGKLPVVDAAHASYRQSLLLCQQVKVTCSNLAPTNIMQMGPASFPLNICMWPGWMFA